jgi:hypothetical protein
MEDQLHTKYDKNQSTPLFPHSSHTPSTNPTTHPSYHFQQNPGFKNKKRRDLANRAQMGVLMMKAAAKIQWHYGGFKVRKEIAEKAEEEPGEAKSKMFKKPEERAILQFKDMVKRKGLTLQAFFPVLSIIITSFLIKS